MHLVEKAINAGWVDHVSVVLQGTAEAKCR